MQESLFLEQKLLLPLHEVLDQLYTLLEARPSSCVLAQGGKEIPFPKEDPIIGGFPNHVEEAKGNNAVIYRVDLAPHAEEGGALAPTRGILEPLQGIP